MPVTAICDGDFVIADGMILISHLHIKIDGKSGERWIKELNKMAEICEEPVDPMLLIEDAIEAYVEGN